MRVRRPGVNPVDWKIREGYLAGAFPSHFPLVPGWDAAGVVVAVGPAVAGFAVGDEVDRVRPARRHPARHVRRAGAGPGAGAGGQAGRRRPGLRRPACRWPGSPRTRRCNRPGTGGGRHGAGARRGRRGRPPGGADRPARSGADRVIGTASPANHDFVRSLGAEPVDVRRRPGSTGSARSRPTGWTWCWTCSAGRGAGRLGRAARPAGAADLHRRPGARRAARRQLRLRQAVHRGPHRLAGLVDAGRLTVDVERTFPLAQAADAHRLVEAGHVRGKVVLEV